MLPFLWHNLIVKHPHCKTKCTAARSIRNMLVFCAERAEYVHTLRGSISIQGLVPALWYIYNRITASTFSGEGSFASNKFT